MILTLVKGIKHFFLYLKHLRSNLLSFDTFLKFEITPPQYANGDPLILFFKKKGNAHANIYQFFNIHEFVFFRILMQRSTLFPYIFHTKKAVLDTYFDIAPVSLQSR